MIVLGEEKIYRASLALPCWRGRMESSMGKISSFVPWCGVISVGGRTLRERERGKGESYVDEQQSSARLIQNAILQQREPTLAILLQLLNILIPKLLR